MRSERATSICGSTGRSRALRWLGAASLLGLFVHCTEDVRLGRNTAEGGASVTLDASAGSGLDPEPPPGDAALPPPAQCTRVPCRNMFLECGNCDDDDGDGLVDAADPECLGPCDNDESALVSGAVNVRPSCRVDCYFDLNAGGGDDGCDWSLDCDPVSVAPGFPPTGLPMCAYEENSLNCAVDANTFSGCQERCVPLTPNGCDCFGCCELPADSQRYVWLGSPSVADGTCDLEDPSSGGCPTCTPVAACANDCADCELCVGKRTLPAQCGQGGGVLPVCSDGRRACDPARGIECGPLEYCITGCCALLPE